MSRASSTFRQRDVTAAIKAAKAAGLAVARIEVDKTGKIVVVMTKGNVDALVETVRDNNEWDEVL